jgi:hypothetical protein
MVVAYLEALQNMREVINPFQSRDAIWHHTFNSVLHMLEFWGLERINPFQPKIL